MLCATGALLLSGEKKKPLGLRKYDAVEECVIFLSQLLLSLYP